MNKWRSFCLGFAFSLISLIAMAEEQGAIKPQLLLSEVIQGMPKGEKAGSACSYGELQTRR